MPITVTLPVDTHLPSDIGHTSDHNKLVDAISTIANYRGITNFYNVKAAPYNAKGDGSTDDTAAIQAAYNACHAAGGGCVYLPASTYRTNALTTYANTTTLGDGPNASILNLSNNSAAFVLGTDATAANCVLVNFGIQVGQPNNQGTTHGLYLVSNGSSIALHRVSNVYVYYAGGDGFHLGAAIIETVLDGCFAYGCCEYGFATEISATDNKFNTCSAAQSGSHGFQIQGNTTHYVNCKSYYSGFINNTSGSTTANWNNANGFNLAPSSGHALSRVWLTSCESQNNATNGFFLDGSAGGGAQIDHVTMSDCSSDGDNVKNAAGGGFKFYNVIDSKITNLNVNTGSGPVTGSFINYGLVLYGTLTNTTFQNCHFEGNVGNVFLDASVTSTYKMSNCTGYNPLGKIGSPPTIAANNVAVTNTTGVDCMVIVTLSASGGATSISLGGNGTGITSSTASAVLPPVRVPANETITLTYTNAPTWTWWGD
jgi:hypothetical protein